jgi:hypothetical protein
LLSIRGGPLTDRYQRIQERRVVDGWLPARHLKP